MLIGGGLLVSAPAECVFSSLGNLLIFLFQNGGRPWGIDAEFNSASNGAISQLLTCNI